MAQPKVEMYTKAMCPSMNREKRAEMNKRSGRNTFPQIFIDAQHIGGSDDLAALERKGELDALLGL